LAVSQTEASLLSGETPERRSTKLVIFTMEARLQGLFLALVLLASMFSHGGSFFSNRVGRKRSIRTQSYDELRLRKDELCEFGKRTCS